MEHLVSPTDPIALKTLNPGFNSLTVATTTSTAALAVTTTPATGSVLTSDSKGNATWQTPTVGASLNMVSISGATGSAVSGATPVMLGYGQSFQYTPIRSGTVFVTMVGTMEGTVTSLSATLIPRYGTGTAPVNGAAATGTSTLLGQQCSPGTGAGTQSWPVNWSFFLQGLTLGTAYWFDVSGQTSSGSVTVLNFRAQIVEF